MKDKKTTEKFLILLVFIIYGQLSAFSQNTPNSLFELGEEFYDSKDLENAKFFYKKSLDLMDNRNETNSFLYFLALQELSFIASEQDDFLAAVHYMERAIKVDNDTIKKAINEDIGKSTPYKLLSDYYAEAGMWDKSLAIKRKRIDNKNRKYTPTNIGMPDHEFDHVMDDFLFRIENTSDYKYAIRILKELNQKYGFYNYWLGECYSNLNNYDQALMYYEKDISIGNVEVMNWKKQVNHNTIDSKFGMARVLAAKGDLGKAIKIMEGVVEEENEKRKHSINTWHESLWKFIDTLSKLYIMNGEYDKAIECGVKNHTSTQSFQNIACAYLGKKQWSKAKDYAAKANSSHQQDKSAVSTLMILAQCAFRMNDSNELEKNYTELYACLKNELLLSFQELTYDERSKYIERYSETLNDLMKYVYYMPSETMASLAYDALLLTKGALLSSEHSVKRIINGSNDASLKKLWEELRADRYILGKQLEKDSLERKLNTDSLQRVIYDLEDSLIIKCKEYEDITKSMQLKHLDIQHSLSSHDIAIEFLRVPIEHDSTMYVALALRKDTKTPKMIPLFEEKQLKQIPDTLYHQCEEMYDLVWKPLATELQGVENIYFSPSGVLYNIGIEYLPGMEKYNVYRLSSTRELVTKKERTIGNRAVLYGGLDYNAPLDTLGKEESLLALNDVFPEHTDVRGLSLRGSQNELPHTKDEVKEISTELRKAKWTCLLDTMSLGTEESFKALSGKKINILHIATHGFYYTPEEADNTMYNFLRLDERWATAEDKSLTRSGLIMSGANHVLERKELPDNVEDGILTAKEIADVDLRGLDLVVLSACQTGLGDITQGEGVFGLQRGFKKAGANTILMSLWKVDDKATQILMTQFYKNWLSGQSNRKALLSAQKYLREIQGGKYNDPKYWAAFIMLDAIQE